jgi:DNA-binding transcriptional MocR family regulator
MEERYKDLELLTLCGSQDGLLKLGEAILSPGDYIVTEEYVYPGLISGVRIINVFINSILVNIATYY